MTENKMASNKFITAGKTKLVKGSITSPELGSLRLIPVFCSTSGKPEQELYNVLSKKWKTAIAELKGWHSYQVDYKLGNIHTTAVNSDIWVIHCLCYDQSGNLDTKALNSCLTKVAAMAKYEKGSVHISTLLTEGVEGLGELLVTEMIDKGLNVYFYEEANK